jgi:hypothetical protein
MPYRLIDENAISAEQSAQLEISKIGISLSDAEYQLLLNALNNHAGLLREPAAARELIHTLCGQPTPERTEAPKPKFKYKRTAKHKKGLTKGNQ